MHVNKASHVKEQVHVKETHTVTRRRQRGQRERIVLRSFWHVLSYLRKAQTPERACYDTISPPLTTTILANGDKPEDKLLTTTETAPTRAHPSHSHTLVIPPTAFTLSKKKNIFSFVRFSATF